MATPEDRLYQQLDRIEGKLDIHIRDHNLVHDQIEKDIRERPTRKENMSLLAGAGTISGILYGLIKLVG